MDSSLVSIIVPCYNATAHIDTFASKIAEQTYKNIQLIFVNDGSTDDTEAELLRHKAFLEKQGYVFTYVRQENKGVGGAVNTGLKHIRGDFFAWCDVDCYYDNSFVEKFVRMFESNPEINIAQCDGAYVDKNSLTVIRKYSAGYKSKPSKNRFDDAIFERDFHVGCAMIRTQEFDRINPDREIYESRQGQNWPLLIPMLYQNECEYIDEVLFFNVFDADSVSNAPARKGFAALLEQEAEYKRILYHVIDILNMSEEEKEKYLRNIDIKYWHRGLSLSQHFGQVDVAEDYYKKLKDANEVSKMDRINYYRAKSKVLDGLCKFAGNIKRAMSRRG